MPYNAITWCNRLNINFSRSQLAQQTYCERSADRQLVALCDVYIE